MRGLRKDALIFKVAWFNVLLWHLMIWIELNSGKVVGAMLLWMLRGSHYTFSGWKVDKVDAEGLLRVRHVLLVYYHSQIVGLIALLLIINFLILRHLRWRLLIRTNWEFGDESVLMLRQVGIARIKGGERGLRSHVFRIMSTQRLFGRK